MLYSISSILTTIFLSSIMIFFIGLMFENVKVIKYTSINSIIFCIMIVALRLLFPIEFDIAKNIPSKFFMTKLIFYLEKPLLSIKGYYFTSYHVFLILWLLGIIYMCLKIGFVQIRFNKAINILPTIKDKDIQEILEKVIKNYPYYKDFKIVQASRCVVPFIYDCRNPIIVLPKIDFTEEELYHILNHEIAHHYNYDFLFKSFIGFLGVIYWWNPAIFFLRNQISIWLEIRADITATKHLDDLEKISYFECLLKIAKNFKVVKSNNILSTFHNNNLLLKKRFYATKLYSKQKISKKEFKNNFCIIVLTAFITYMSFYIVFEPYYIDPSKTENTVELTAETAYLLKKENGNYDIHFNGVYYATVSKIPDSLSELPIYK